MELKGLGRRKSSIARVIIKEGTGKITINGVDSKKFFPNDIVIQDMEQPLVIVGVKSKYDVVAKVNGGGFSGQAGAIRLAISRALAAKNADTKQKLREKKMLTRDSRQKERKKVGKYGARRSPQFVKR
jgi:small subunit ribosomal protein S9